MCSEMILTNSEITIFHSNLSGQKVHTVKHSFQYDNNNS